MPFNRSEYPFLLYKRMLLSKKPSYMYLAYNTAIITLPIAWNAIITPLSSIILIRLTATSLHMLRKTILKRRTSFCTLFVTRAHIIVLRAHEIVMSHCFPHVRYQSLYITQHLTQSSLPSKHILHK